MVVSCRSPDVDLPRYKFHGLKGDCKGTYSVWVSGNWRITFGIENGYAMDVNLEDYHS
ncbi:MAG: type II toxin-antitoxin system RelE/ParE family toxin [Betaproteobacteria bacterium]|nr:type II toxin-antitoxin system RelE/ParE family toxin [Betaproteobacteria bacterium]